MFVPQSSVPYALDDLTQLGSIGFDNEVDRQAVVRPRLWRPDDGHQCSSGLSSQAHTAVIAMPDLDRRSTPFAF